MVLGYPKHPTPAGFQVEYFARAQIWLLIHIYEAAANAAPYLLTHSNVDRFGCVTPALGTIQLNLAPGEVDLFAVPSTIAVRGADGPTRSLTPGLHKMRFEDRLAPLVEHEASRRHDRKLKRLFRAASLPEAAALEGLDPRAQRGWPHHPASRQRGQYLARLRIWLARRAGST